MSDASSSLSPVKAFLKDKSEKIDTIKKEVKALRKDINNARENHVDVATKKEAYHLMSAKRAEYHALRKSHFTPSE